VSRSGATEPLSDPDIEATGGRAGRLIVRDGLRLRTAVWLPAGAARDIVLLGGRSEFIEKFFETIGELAARGFRVWAMDWRGHGLSDRPLADPLKCHIDRYETYLDDLDLFMSAVVRPAGPMRPLVLANSMGGHLALRYMHDHPAVFAAAVLIAPMLDVWTDHYPPTIARAMAASAYWLGLAEHFIPGGSHWHRADIRFEGNRLTSDPHRFQDEAKWLARHPALALTGPTYGWVHATFASIDLCSDPAYARAITTPVLMVAAGEERVVRNDAQVRFAAIMARCQRVEIAEARHEILKETDAVRARLWAAFDGFVGAAPAAAGPMAAGLSSAAARA
jgi:lysophospholipase